MAVTDELAIDESLRAKFPSEEVSQEQQSPALSDAPPEVPNPAQAEGTSNKDVESRASGDAASTGRPDDWLTPDLIGRATRWGMDSNTARNWGSAEGLEQALDQISGQYAQQPPPGAYQQPPQVQPQQPQQQQQWAEQPAPSPEPQPPPQPQPQQTQPQPPPMFSPYEFKLDPEEVGDETMAKELGDFIEHSNGQANVIGQLANQLQTLQQHIDNEQYVRYCNQFDSLCNTVPEQYQELLGKGVLSEMDPAGPQAQNRKRLESTYAKYLDTKLPGGSYLSENDAYDEALAVTFRAYFQPQQNANGHPGSNAGSNGRTRNQSTGRFVAHPTSVGDLPEASKEDLLEMNPDIQRISERTGVPIR